MKSIEHFMVVCLAVFRHLSRRRSVLLGAAGITAFGCLQEEVISNQMPDDLDNDGDGVAASLDCDDDDPNIRERTENGCVRIMPTDPCDDEMISCNPLPDFDEDGDMDGFFAEDDCDDSNALINPEASYEPGSPEAQRLEQLACERGEAVDANCDNEPDFACVIVNPPPPMDGDMDGYFGDDDCDDTDARIFPDAEYQPGTRGWAELEALACQRGTPIDFDCDDVAEIECMITVNPLPDGDDPR